MSSSKTMKTNSLRSQSSGVVEIGNGDDHECDKGSRFNGMASAASGSFLDSIGQGVRSDEEEEQEFDNCLLSNAVFKLKLVVLLLLVCLTIVGAILVFHFTSAEEQEEFEYHYQVASGNVLAALGASVDNILGGTDSLAFSMVHDAKRTNSTWPFVTTPNFYLMNKKFAKQSSAVWTTVYHLVSAEQRLEWEAYTATHNDWVDQDISQQENDPTYHGPIIKEREDYDVIHEWDEYYKENPGVEGTNRTGPYYLPNWQSSPVIPEYPIYNWDLLSIYDTRSIDAVLEGHGAVLSEAYMLPDLDNPALVEESESTADWFKGYIGPDEDPMEPVSDLLYPIHNHMDVVLSLEDQELHNHDLVAVIGISFYWRDVLRDAIASGETVDVVFRNECNPTFTYRLDGPDVLYLGRGDLHNPKYDSLEVTAPLKDLNQYGSTSKQSYKAYSGVPISEEYCPFVVSVYPTEVMEEQYTSSNPGSFTVVTALILALTAFSFILYDCKVGSRQRQTNHRLAEANEKLREASALQLRHFAMMSHEIRTPLNGIVGMASLLQEDVDNLTQQQKESIRMIISSGELLRTVVNDVLDYSKLSAGHQNIEVSQTNLQESLASVIYSTETRAQTKGITLQTEYDENLPAFISTDGRRLQQILFNLLSNAIKFSPKDETVVLGVCLVPLHRESAIPMTSSFKLRAKRESTLRFYVEDHGEGIAPECLKTIFEPFAQATLQTERIHGGTGLGLSITKKLVEALGGSVSVVSELGKYARFTVDFSLDVPENFDCESLSVDLVENTTVYLACRKQSTVDKAGRIFAHFRVPLSVHPNMQDMESKAQQVLEDHSSNRIGQHPPDQISVFLVDEDLFDDQAASRLASLSRRTSTLTFGPQNSVKQSQHHFRSIEQMIPSALLQSIDQIITSSETSLNKSASLRSTSYRLSDISKSIRRERRSMSDLRVLVAEDNAINQKVISRILGRIGVECVTIVDNGQKAATSEAEEPFDVVLMDMEMPVMDGLESCRQIQKRSSGNHPRAPVVFLTAHVLDDIREECLQAGAVSFLGKPYNLKEVSECLKRIALCPAVEIHGRAAEREVDLLRPGPSSREGGIWDA